MAENLRIIGACAIVVFVVCLFITPRNSDRLNDMFPEVFMRIAICGTLSMVVWAACAIALVVIAVRGK